MKIITLITKKGNMEAVVIHTLSTGDNIAVKADTSISICENTEDENVFREIFELIEGSELPKSIEAMIKFHSLLFENGPTLWQALIEGKQMSDRRLLLGDMLNNIN